MKHKTEHTKNIIGFGQLLIIFFLIISLQLYAEQVEQQRPMYADTYRNKNPEFVAQDTLFIAKATHTFGTREHASEGYVERGFDNYASNKFDKSMHRFNQAWLLNNDNPYVYLGFGLLLNKEEKACEAYEMFKLANEKGLNESGFLVDYAYTASQCALLKKENEKEQLFNTSNDLYTVAIQTPNQKLLAYAYHSWAKSYYLQSNFLKSREMIQQSKNLGGTIDTSLLKALENKK